MHDHSVPAVNLPIRGTCFLLFSTLICGYAYSQKTIAITIDDVPNVGLYESNQYRSTLLKRLDSLQLPIAIFINEANVYRTDSIGRNTSLLGEWAARRYVTLGNHSYSHPAYSMVGFTRFSEEVTKGEQITTRLARKEKKDVRYFRFPFNDLGKDSAEHLAIRNFLHKEGYLIAPFTVESQDWMYTVLYERYLKEGNPSEAKRVAMKYVDLTLSRLDYFEGLADARYHRPIAQIYLCHDNALNADYLPVLIKAFKARKYSFVSLAEALKDDVYNLEDYYQGKAGFSWIYRWIKDPQERMKLMRAEPEDKASGDLYEKTLK